MTFREKLAHVAKDDPDFARSARRWRIASWVFGIAVVVALFFGIGSLVIGVSNKNQITKIESPCLKYGPDSEQCEEAFSAAVSTITHPQACAIERKAGTLRAIRELADELGVEFAEPCAGARIEQERVRGNERAKTRRAAAERGDALQTGSTGNQQPGPRGGGEGVGAGRGGSDQGDAPAPDEEKPTPADPSPVPTATTPSPSSSNGGGSSSNPGGSASTPAPASPSLIPETVEAASKGVEQAGGAAQGVVESTGKTVDCVLRGSC